MTWFKVDQHLGGHPAAAIAGDSALGAWLRVGCWLARFPQQQGFIPTVVAKRMCTDFQRSRLVRSGLWDPVDGGYQQHVRLSIATSHLPGAIWAIDLTGLRKAIPEVLRHDVYERDGFACVDCGRRDDLSLDHIFPWSLGGEDTFDNLRTLCRPCNSRKGARLLEGV